MKYKYIRLLNLITVICLLLLITGCSKTGDSSKSNNSADSGQVTQSNDITTVPEDDKGSSPIAQT
jgi:PBP1b-binding outer membrane lipoprotein LpoB